MKLIKKLKLIILRKKEDIMATKRFKKNTKISYAGKLWQCVIANAEIAVFCRKVGDTLSRAELMILDQSEADTINFKEIK